MTDPDGGAEAGGEGGIVTGTDPDKKFTLTAPTARTFIVQGQSVTITLTFDRGAGAVGPATVAFTDLPDGVTATNTVSADAAPSLRVTLTATAAAVQKLAQVTVTATTSANDGTTLTAPAKFELYLRGPSGAVDTTFGTSGHLSAQEVADDGSPLILVGPHDEIYTHGTGAGCKSGAADCIKRFTPDGSPDPTFGPAATMGEANAYNTLDGIITPDNRWIGVGTGPTATPTQVYRLKADGSPDTSFGGGTGVASFKGLVGITGGTAFGGEAIGLGADGSMAIGYPLYAPPQTANLGIVRLDAAGGLIANFGTVQAGFSSWQPSTSSIRAPAIEVKSTGAVILATSAGSANQVAGATLYAATELGADGAPYINFGPNGDGKISTPYPFSFDDIEEYTGHAIFPDGSIVFPMAKRVIKVTTLGQWDTTFNTTGYYDFDTQLYAITGTSDGKVVVFARGNSSSSVLRLAADGTLDMTFGTNGIAAVNVLGFQRGRVAVQSDKRILVLSTNDITRLWD